MVIFIQICDISITCHVNIYKQTMVMYDLLVLM